MGSAFQKAIAQVSASSELQLSPTTATGLQRVIPLGLAINVWLKKSMLFGVILVAIALIILAIAIPKGSLPTFVALWIDHRVAKGVVDSVQRREITKSKGMKETRWEIRYHFTSQNGQQLQGESYTSFSAHKKGAQVDVEYYPKRPESNRIRGMTAKSDANSPAVLCFILMAVGLVAIAAELRTSFVTSNLLKSGVVGTAVVTHCKELTSGATWEFNGFRWKSPRQSKGKEILLADYQQLLRSNSGNAKIDDVSLLLKKRACILQFQSVDAIEPIRIERELNLKGDASDSLPRPILYPQGNPTSAKLVDSLGLKSSIGPNGELALTADSPIPQLIALPLIAISVVIVLVVALPQIDALPKENWLRSIPSRSYHTK